MPLIHLKNTSEECCWGVWKISETIEELSNLLDIEPSYLGFLDNISHPQKKKESLAARVVIKQILKTWNIHFEGIVKDGHEKPFLPHTDWHISMSHTKDYAVGIVHKRLKVGIDLEAERPKLNRVAHKFLSPPEIQSTQQNLLKLTIAWVAKEALYKMNGKKQLSLRQDMLILPFIPENQGTLEAILYPQTPQAQPYEIKYQKFKNYFIAHVF